MYILGLVLLLGFVTCGECKPRGVSISKAVLYEPKDGLFTCFDGSKTIPYEEINDDFCDCPDGSDEPGTPACPNGWFHCTNAGYIPLTLPSSRVDDFICDCCDGTDEPNTATVCKNRCIAMGRQLKAEEAAQREKADKGSKLRKQWAEQGKKNRQAKQNSLEKLKAERETVADLKLEKEARSDELQKIESEAKSKHEAQIEAQNLALQAKMAFEELDTNEDGVVDVMEIQARSELDLDNDGAVSRDEALGHLEDNKSVEIDQFETFVWPHLKTHFSPKQNDTIQQASNGELEYSDELKQIIDDASKAKDDFNEINDRLNDINNKVKSFEDYLSLDFGPDDAFDALYDQCFEYTDREYTYKLCAFKQTSQRPKDGGSETSLGNWQGWSGTDDKYKTMSFTNGQGCWQGPPRSTKVTLQCGVENKLTSASEPNRCEYAFDFSTPAACSATPPAPKQRPAHTEL